MHHETIAAVRRLRNEGVGLADIALQVGVSKSAVWRALNQSGYPAVKIDGKSRYLHRLILDLEPGDALEGDHLNRNVLDNRRCNLQACTSIENNANRGGVFEASNRAA